MGVEEWGEDQRWRLDEGTGVDGGCDAKEVGFEAEGDAIGHWVLGGVFISRESDGKEG